MKLTGYFFLLCALLFACKSNTSTEITEDDSDKIKAVCISDGVPVRETPGKDGKWLTSLNLGESLIYLDEEYKDPEGKGQDFYKVELSDGSQVWARSYGICLKAKAAAVLSETPIYKRPDLVNKTDKVFKTIEFVAVIGEKDDWVEVIGANKKKSGWVKVQYLSANEEDVAVATLAHKSLLDKEGNIVDDKLQKFIEELPYKNTRFNGYLSSLLDEQAIGEIEENINEYQNIPEGQETETYTEENQGE